MPAARAGPRRAALRPQHRGAPSVASRPPLGTFSAPLASSSRGATLLLRPLSLPASSPPFPALHAGAGAARHSGSSPAADMATLTAVQPLTLDRGKRGCRRSPPAPPRRPRPARGAAEAERGVFPRSPSAAGGGEAPPRGAQVGGGRGAAAEEIKLCAGGGRAGVPPAGGWRCRRRGMWLRRQRSAPRRAPGRLLAAASPPPPCGAPPWAPAPVARRRWPSRRRPRRWLRGGSSGPGRPCLAASRELPPAGEAGVCWQRAAFWGAGGGCGEGSSGCNFPARWP